MDGLRDRYNAFIERHEVARELSFVMLALALVADGMPRILRSESCREGVHRIAHGGNEPLEQANVPRHTDARLPLTSDVCPVSA